MAPILIVLMNSQLNAKIDIIYEQHLTNYKCRFLSKRDKKSFDMKIDSSSQIFRNLKKIENSNFYV